MSVTARGVGDIVVKVIAEPKKRERSEHFQVVARDERCGEKRRSNVEAPPRFLLIISSAFVLFFIIFRAVIHRRDPKRQKKKTRNQKGQSNWWSETRSHEATSLVFRHSL
ncbi:hypothetical protein EUGRSUZ_E00698 [Eucalyptus grandis]|uniref:Uncharacterized protein n=2 Tax=Eucalyptus grandis TaxID=71139 RepID=A0ACC3KUR0_EUCGR|nr:hypothetical protein EUGRSUZ_E00698 [Eucalyptus grandis]